MSDWPRYWPRLRDVMGLSAGCVCRLWLKPFGFRNKDLGKFGLLYLHDPDSPPRIHRRFAVLKDVFQREGLDHVSFREWEMPGSTRVQRIFAALAFAEWCSYTLALLDGLDPTPVELVETFKKELDAGPAE